MTSQDHRSGQAWGVVFALLAAVGFSAKAIFVKLAYEAHPDAVTLLALRMAWSMPFFLALACWAKKPLHAPRLEPRDAIQVLGLGLLGYYLSSFLDFWGLEYISASLERLILFLYPTITVLLGAMLARQRVRGHQVLAMGLSYLGLACVFMQARGLHEKNLWLGSALVFASTLSYAIYLVGAGHAIARLGAMRFTAWAMLVASGASIAQFIGLRTWSALHLSARIYELSLAMAIFSTVLPVLLLSLAIQRLGAGTTSLLGSIGPVSTIGLAFLVLHEPITALQVFGSSLVLLGVLIIGQMSRSK